MAEYIVLSLGIVGIMFFLIDMSIIVKPARESIENPKGDPKKIVGIDPMQYYKLVFVIGAFLLGIPLLGLGVGVADELGASVTVKAAINSAYTGYIWFSVISIFLLLIYYLVLVPVWVKAALSADKDEEMRDEYAR